MTELSKLAGIPLSKRVEVLLDLAENGEVEALNNKLERLLTNPYASTDHHKEIKHLYDQDKHSPGRYFGSLRDPICAGLLRKAFGFFLFASAAEEAADAMDNGEKDKAKEATDSANEYLRDPETAAFIFEKYKVPPPYHEVLLSLHRTGTTSYILKFNMATDNYVLKIVKFYYLDNELIAESTEGYLNPFKNPDLHQACAPKIFETREGFIIMEYIQGKSLRDYMYNDLIADPAMRLGRTREIISTLCSILGHYAGNRFTHLDLSPDNILIRDNEKGQTAIQMVLIDFGYNYLLNKKVGSSTRFEIARTYIAPELMPPGIQRRIKDFPLEKKVTADVYSLGVILLEMLSRENLIKNGKFSEFNRSKVIERIRREYHGLADVLEDVTASDSNIRLFCVTPERADDSKMDVTQRMSNVYDNINRRVNVELLIYEKVYLRATTKKSWWILLRVLQITHDPVATLLKQWHKYDYLARENFEGIDLNRVKQIRNWSFLCQSINICMVLLTYVLAGYFYAQPTRAALVENLPRLLVGISFSLLATQYYMSIFSTLFPGDVRVKLANLKGRYSRAFNTLSKSEFQSRLPDITEKSFRLSSFYFGILIAMCYILDRRLWPWLTALACMFTVANNYFSYHFALEARKIMVQELGEDAIPQSMDDFLNPDEYRNWYLVFLVYACAPLAIGIGLWRGWISDEPVYALIIVLVNAVMLKRRCSGREAERIRVELERAISGYSKALKYREYKDAKLAGNSTLAREKVHPKSRISRLP